MFVLAIIFIDSIYRTDESCYTKVFLENITLSKTHKFIVILMNNIMMKNVPIYF